MSIMALPWPATRFSCMGIARGTVTPTVGQPTKFVNNCFLVLKKQPDGKLRMWRIAFAPNSQ